jgi:hypothetical protein
MPSNSCCVNSPLATLRMCSGHHLGSEPVHALDAAGQALDLHLGPRRADLADFDLQVRTGCVRLAQQCVTFALFLCEQSERPPARIEDVARTNACTA